MSDPLSVLRQPDTPVDPDPAFAVQLWARLERALRLPKGVQIMTTTTEPFAADPTHVAAHTLTPYLAVREGRRALDWYIEVFAARLRWEPTVMPDGRIGHSAVVIGDSVLMLSEEFPELDVLGPQSRGGSTCTLVIAVPDVDRVIERAVAAGARLERPARDEPFGRTGVIHDPFGHRWMVQTPPAAEPGQPAQPRPAS
jgi:uncharacterized glyoxalase superfamily protein PhnB